MQILINLIINGLAVYVTSLIVPGVFLNDFFTAIIVSVILGIANTIIKPILLLFTLPLNILTLGLFTFVINAVIILIVDSFVPGFRVNGFLSALLFSLVLSVVSTVIQSLTR